MRDYKSINSISLQRETSFFFLSFFFLMAPAVAYGHSWARGQIRAAAAAILPDASRICDHATACCWILNPLSEARDQTLILVDTVGFLTCWVTMETPRPLSLGRQYLCLPRPLLCNQCPLLRKPGPCSNVKILMENFLPTKYFPLLKFYF